LWINFAYWLNNFNNIFDYSLDSNFLFKASELWSEFDSNVAGEKENDLSAHQMIDIEVKRFLNLPCEDRSKTDPLKWWSTVGKSLFPTISRVAFKYLIVPATSVPCERLFSIAGQVLSEKRTSLKDETARALICLHENLN
jgi:hypothetical protein